MEKLISVIIPVYNVEKYLRTCLDSVLNQTYQNIEIILVNDGSTDSSSTICDEYSKKDKRITVIHQANQGVSTARNAGLNLAKGDYYYFVDSDDCINIRLFEMLIQIAEKYQTKMVQVQLMNVEEDFEDYSLEIDDSYKVLSFSRSQALLNNDEGNKEFARDIQMSTIVVWSKLYRADIFEEFRFPEGIRIHEDQMIIHRLIAKANGMVFCTAPLYYYRTHEDSLIRQEWTPQKLYIIECFRDRFLCAAELPEEETTEYHLKEKFLRRYFICIINNYMVVCDKTFGKDRKKYQKEIIGRLKKDLKLYGKILPFKLRGAFCLFSLFPSLYVFLFKLRDRIRASKKNELIVEPLAGMGNRFLALASAHELAVKSGKKLAVIWNVDGALGTKSKNIIELPEDIKIYETTNLGFRKSPGKRLYSEFIRWWFRKTSNLYYNQDEIAEFADKYMDIEVEKHRKIYVKSWKEFTDIETNSKEKFAFIQPGPMVLSRGEKLFDKINKDTIGIHIRRTDHIDAILNSPIELFVENMEEEIRINTKTLFFLSTDDKQVEKEIIEQFKDKVFVYEGKCFQRMGSEGAQDALVDMLALSKCKKIYASFGSTFSRMAGYIGGCEVQVLKNDG